MTDTPTNDQLPETTPQQPRRPRRWRGALAGVLLLGLGAIGGYAAGAMHGSWWILSAAAHGNFDPARFGKRIDRRVDRVLDRVDANQEQRDKVSGIFKNAVNDIAALGFKPGEMHEKFIALMRADTVDPAAFEALRAEQVGKVDTASKRIIQAMTEAAQVLTPEQRRQLADRWQEGHGWWGHGHHHDHDRDR